jgi:hypothetical protein
MEVNAVNNLNSTNDHEKHHLNISVSIVHTPCTYVAVISAIFMSCLTFKDSILISRPDNMQCNRHATILHHKTNLLTQPHKAIYFPKQ